MIESPPRQAATIIVLKDGDNGLSCCMLQRNLNSDFVGGAYVFPGGAVDAIDKELYGICDGVSDEEASLRLGVEKDGLSFYIAAIRECFEEAGIFIGQTKNPEELGEYRKKLNDKSLNFAELCERLSARLLTNRLTYLSHWITPIGPPRRYSTRFFITAVDRDQTAAHDETETVNAVWINPADAIKKADKGEFPIIFPTRKHLELLSSFKTIEDMIAYAKSLKDIPTTMPKIVEKNGELDVLIPGDIGYE
jgi:8-oxo-dGTP pyrophosphatase MutT (NUDIX family)